MSESFTDESAAVELYTKGHELADIAREAHKRRDDINAERFRKLANDTFRLAGAVDPYPPYESIVMFGYEELEG